MKQTLKKSIAIALVALLLLTGAPLAGFAGFESGLTAQAATIVDSGTCGNNLTWSLDALGTLTISGTGTMKNYFTYSDVPWYSIRSSIKTVIIEDSVTSIGDYAFRNCNSLTSVTIPDSVTSIGGDAFCNCKSLTSVTIPDSVTSIGDYAFRNCHSLTSVYITDLAAWCNIDFDYYSSNPLFYYSSNPLYYAHNLYLNGTLVTEITIPDSVTSIGDYAFCYCTSLTSVTIPDSVTSIGDDAFFECTSLTSVYITDLAAWCNIDFSSYTSNPLNYARNIYLNGALLTALTIPDSVTSIGDSFAFCTSLTSVTIPDSVTSIGDDAFYICKSLTSVTIGDSVTNIGNRAFRSCTSLTSVTIPDSVTSIGEYAFYYCNSLTDVYFAGSNAEWNSIEIGDWNDPLLNANIHFNYHEHDYTAVVTAPTCENDGYTTYTCTCGDTYVADYIPAHSYTSTVTKAATCTAAGVKTFTCSKCSNSYTETIAATGHSWTAATCTAAKTCSTCNATEGSALGHSYTSKITKAATCTAAGVKTFTCSKCSNSYTETIAATGHSWTAASCTAAKTCSTCNATEGSALGHSWDEGVVTTEPTVEANGVMTYTCCVCGATKTESIEKLQPAFTESEDAVITENGSICTLVGKTADALLAQAGAGATLVDKDGNAISSEANVGTGAVLTLADGTQYEIIVPGDTNGDAVISSSDARFTLRYAVGLETIAEDSAFAIAANVNAGSITASDARSILRCAVGLDDPTEWFENLK